MIVLILSTFFISSKKVTFYSKTQTPWQTLFWNIYILYLVFFSVVCLNFLQKFWKLKCTQLPFKGYLSREGFLEDNPNWINVSGSRSLQRRIRQSSNPARSGELGFRRRALPAESTKWKQNLARKKWRPPPPKKKCASWNAISRSAVSTRSLKMGWEPEKDKGLMTFSGLWRWDKWQFNGVTWVNAARFWKIATNKVLDHSRGLTWR